MQGDPTLFDVAGPTARHSDPQTSVEAGKQAVGNSRLRLKILGEYEIRGRFGGDGLTDDELSMCLPVQHPGSVSKRRHDLTVAGLLEDSGETRPTRYGCEAIVWRITPLGVEVARNG